MRPNLPQHFGDSDRAVSPVIGVVLMVIITTALAAITGGLATGMVKDHISEPAPDVTVSAEVTDTGDVVIVHEGGDEIDVSNLRIVVHDANGAEVSTSNTASGTLQTGETFTISKSSGDFSTGSYEILLIDTNTEKIIDKGLV